MAPASGGSSMRGLMIAVVVALPLLAHAGGSNYGVAPGARPELSGKISEWPVPTPQFARDPAPGPDGAIYIAVMFGNKIARFDPRTRAFRARSRNGTCRRALDRTASWWIATARSGTRATATGRSATSIRPRGR